MTSEHKLGNCYDRLIPLAELERKEKTTIMETATMETTTVEAEYKKETDAILGIEIQIPPLPDSTVPSTSSVNSFLPTSLGPSVSVSVSMDSPIEPKPFCYCVGTTRIHHCGFIPGQESNNRQPRRNLADFFTVWNPRDLPTWKEDDSFWGPELVDNVTYHTGSKNQLLYQFDEAENKLD